MVGTGPYMLTEWVKGSSLTYSKNPDYWDFDEKYPENRLPYIDQINRLIMPDKATSRAALRSGKIDYIGQPGINQFQAAEVESFQRTNPDIVLSPWALRSETSVAFNLRHPSPFQDIRVRKAMQMAIDIETINNTYFGGFGMTKPQGIIGDGLKGYFIPFEARTLRVVGLSGGVGGGAGRACAEPAGCAWSRSDDLRVGAGGAASGAGELNRVGRLLGAAEGTGPDSDPFLRSQRRESHAAGWVGGHAEGRAEAQRASALQVLETRGVAVSASLAARLAEMDTHHTSHLDPASECAGKGA